MRGRPSTGTRHGHSTSVRVSNSCEITSLRDDAGTRQGFLLERFAAACGRASPRSRRGGLPSRALRDAGRTPASFH